MRRAIASWRPDTLAPLLLLAPAHPVVGLHSSSSVLPLWLTKTVSGMLSARSAEESGRTAKFRELVQLKRDGSSAAPCRAMKPLTCPSTVVQMSMGAYRDGCALRPARSASTGSEIDLVSYDMILRPLKCWSTICEGSRSS